MAVVGAACERVGNMRFPARYLDLCLCYATATVFFPAFGIPATMIRTVRVLVGISIEIVATLVSGTLSMLTRFGGSSLLMVPA